MNLQSFIKPFSDNFRVSDCYRNNQKSVIIITDFGLDDWIGLLASDFPMHQCMMHDDA